MRAEPHGPMGRGPTVAYIPGIDGRGEMLFGTEACLAASFELHRFRYVGTEARGAELYDTLADSIIEHLPEGPSVVIAESFGGAVALSVALRAPERVRGLLLVNTFARFPRRVRIRAGAMLMPFVPTRPVAWARRLVVPSLLVRPRRDAAAERSIRSMRPGMLDGGFPARLRAIRDLDLTGALGRIQVPCALYASTHDRVVPSLKTMAEIASLLPNATLERVERAGHIVLPLEAEPWPERVEELLRRAREMDSRPR